MRTYIVISSGFIVGSIVAKCCTASYARSTKRSSYHCTSKAWITVSTNLKTNNVVDNAFNKFLKATMSWMCVDHTRASGKSPAMSSTHNFLISVGIRGRNSSTIEEKVRCCYKWQRRTFSLLSIHIS